MKKIIFCPECFGTGFIDSDNNSMRVATCDKCRGTGQLVVQMTNFDLIKAMSVEEMAGFILNAISKNMICDYCKFSDDNCEEGYCDNKSYEEIIKEWLESEVQEK